MVTAAISTYRPQPAFRSIHLIPYLYDRRLPADRKGDWIVSVESAKVASRGDLCDKEDIVAKLDPYSITNRLDVKAIGSITTRLEARGENEYFKKMLIEYLDALEPGKLHRVLEVGCGTGVATRALARHPAFRGHISASDLSAELVETAKKLANGEGCADRITFSTADALALEGDEKYDAVIAHTVVSHVPDYRKFIAGLAKSVSNTGTIAIFDGDYASITLGAEDPTDGAAFSSAIIEGIITNPTIMREMPWLAKEPVAILG